MHLVEQFEVGAVGGGAEALDLVQGARLLGAEVVAGKAQNRQALGGVGLVQGRSPAYCLVKPQRLATFTISSTLPA